MAIMTPSQAREMARDLGLKLSEKEKEEEVQF